MRLFLDSGVLIDGILSRWGLSKALLCLCSSRIHLLVLARWVQVEVETAIVRKLIAMGASETVAEAALNDYIGFINRARPELVALPSEFEVKAASRLIRHQNDAPILASAIAARPDWLISTNTRHFNETVARSSGLTIADPETFFRIVHRSASGS